MKYIFYTYILCCLLNCQPLSTNIQKTVVAGIPEKINNINVLDSVIKQCFFDMELHKTFKSNRTDTVIELNSIMNFVFSPTMDIEARGNPETLFNNIESFVFYDYKVNNKKTVIISLFFKDSGIASKWVERVISERYNIVLGKPPKSVLYKDKIVILIIFYQHRNQETRYYLTEKVKNCTNLSIFYSKKGR